jgi:N-formylglutamate amidohydrolase
MDTNVSQLWHLSRDFIPAVDVIEPDGGEGWPLVFGLPHSGRYYPDSFIQGAREALPVLRSTEDAYVDDLIGFSQDMDIRCVRAVYGRSFVDVNRDPRELDARLIKGALPRDALTQTLRVRSGFGVIPRCLSGQREIHLHPIGIDEARVRIARVHAPYHHALNYLLRQGCAQFGAITFIDWHSMPSTTQAGGSRKLPDIVLGDLYGETCDPELTRFVKKQLEAHGLKVGLNMPFAGGYNMETYGKPHRGVHALQIEINRALYMDETTLERTAGFGTLKAALASVIEALKTFRLRTP